MYYSSVTGQISVSNISFLFPATIIKYQHKAVNINDSNQALSSNPPPAS